MNTRSKTKANTAATSAPSPAATSAPTPAAPSLVPTTKYELVSQKYLDALKDIGELDDQDKEAVKLLQKSIDRKTKIRDKLVQLQMEHPELRIQHVSFSRMTLTHLSDMGVTTIEISTEISDIDRILGPGYSGKINLFWNKEKQQFMRVLRQTRKSVSRPAEARARRVTDHFLNYCSLFLEEDLGIKSHQYLELNLSEIDDEPLFIKHASVGTLLTGSVDYTILVVPESKRTRKVKTETFQELPSLDHSNLKQLKDEFVRRHFDFTKLKIWIIEQKSLSHFGNNLFRCVPQVLGEALVIIIQLGIDILPWCLATGELWLFGIVQKVQGQDYQFKNYQSQVSNTDADLILILKMMVAMSVLPDTKLQEMICKDS